MIELSADLRAFLDGRPVLARRPTALYLVRGFAGRHRVGVAAAAIALLGLAGGGALAWKQKRSADEARRRAEREAGDAREALSVLQGIIFKSNPEFGQRADLTVALTGLSRSSVLRKWQFARAWLFGEMFGDEPRT